MLIVSIELKPLSDGEEAAGVNFGGAPLLILTFVVNLDASVWSGVIGTNYQRLFDREIVPGFERAVVSIDTRD